jgi:geranylgeranyl diphosphate synthase type I
MLSVMERADLARRVDAVVAGVLAAERDRMSTISGDLVVLDETLAPFLSGGKRLRAAFCYWGWRGAGGDPNDAETEPGVVQVASALEFLQACALVHDDVMDGSETRRGMAAVHHRFANLHRGQMWLGSPETFGMGSAILIGDLCLSWADQTLTSANIDLAAVMRAKRVYDGMRTELMAGQYLDLQEQARGGGSIDRARTVVAYKSAKYTVERPLHIGAAIADAGSEVVAGYSRYGMPLGEAFQLRDDILGVFGDPRRTGKPAGDDLREGKRTVLLALAFERATPAQRTSLREHLGDPAMNAADIELLREIIVDTGALAATEKLILDLTGEALAAVTGAVADPEARAALVELAHAATVRAG